MRYYKIPNIHLAQVHVAQTEMAQMYLLGTSDVLECLDALSLDARQSKCVSDVLKRALVRRLSIQMTFRSRQMRSRSTLVAPNAFPTCSDVLSLDACRSQCVSDVLK